MSPGEKKKTSLLLVPKCIFQKLKVSCNTTYWMFRHSSEISVAPSQNMGSKNNKCRPVHTAVIQAPRYHVILLSSNGTCLNYLGCRF